MKKKIMIGIAIILCIVCIGIISWTISMPDHKDRKSAKPAATSSSTTDDTDDENSDSDANTDQTEDASKEENVSPQVDSPQTQPPRTMTQAVSFNNVIGCNQFNTSALVRDRTFKLEMEDDGITVGLIFKGDESDWEVIGGLGCIAWNSGFELGSARQSTDLKAVLEQKGYQHVIDPSVGVYGSSIWNLPYEPLTDVMQTRCTNNQGYTLCHFTPIGSGTASVTYEVE